MSNTSVFSQGFARGAAIKAQREQLAQQERQQMIENINSIADKELGVIKGLHEGWAKKGMSFDDPEFQRTIKPMVDDLMALLGRGNPMFPGEVMSQEQAMRLVGSIPMTIATPKDAARLNRLTDEDMADPSIPESVRIAHRDGMLVEVNQHGMLTVSNPASPGGDGDVRDRKIADLVNLYPRLGRAKAVALVDGHARIETDPQGGIVRWINEATGEVVELPISSADTAHGDSPSPGSPAPSPGSPAPSPESPAPSLSGQTLYELAGIATGPAASAREAAGFGIGFLPEGIRESGIFPAATIEARQRFAAETQGVIRALAINPRFPTTEMERIRKEINVMPKFLDNAPMMQARMRGLDYTLEQRQNDAIHDANDTSLPGETRRAARQSARGIENFRRQMGVPEFLSLDTIEDVLSADVETLRGFINTASDDDLANLPDDIVDEILKKVKGQ